MKQEYSKTLSRLSGSTDQRIEQLRSQLQLMQEETEDMLRSMNRAMNDLQEQITELGERLAAENEEATA